MPPSAVRPVSVWPPNRSTTSQRCFGVTVIRAGAWHAWLWRLRLAQARAELALARGDAESAITLADAAIDQARGRRPKYEALGLVTRASAMASLGQTTAAGAPVLRALPLIALGHEASIALVVLLVSGLQFVAAPDVLRVGGATTLIAFGAYKFLKQRSHPRWVGLRVSARELALWSLLMSTAHGAGLMLFPVLVGAHDHAEIPLNSAALVTDVTAVVVHSTAMLVAMGIVAVLVYDRLGLGVLRRAWLNLDRVWATAVVAAGAVTLFT
jgi:hypothetical protein